MEYFLSKDASVTKAEDTVIILRLDDAKDGWAELTISADKMTVRATIHPPVSGGYFLNAQQIFAKLDELEINHGILFEIIQNAVLDANSKKKPVKNIIIAKGDPVVSEIPEHFVFRKDLVEKKMDLQDVNQVDWHEISAFTIVQFKEPLAKRIEIRYGQEGKNIYGENVPFHTEKIKMYSAGQNVIEHKTGLFAGKHGRLSLNDAGVASIEDVLVLQKGVDFKTGNINFPGDVILQGKIADGFKIFTGGSLVSSDVIDVTDIVCKKDLITQSGIEGGGKGSARVGGSVQTRYIQNCRLAARGDITVTGSIVQSKIYTMNSIVMADSSKLVGSECIAIGNVLAFDIGNLRGSRTHIRCGTDFTIQQELDIANEQLKILTLKLKQAEEVVQMEPLPDLLEFIEEAKAKKVEISNRISTFLPRIDTNDAAYIEVRGTIYPGSELEICHVAFSITKAMKQQVFRLDKTKGLIVAEPWKKK